MALANSSIVFIFPVVLTVYDLQMTQSLTEVEPLVIVLVLLGHSSQLL